MRLQSDSGGGRLPDPPPPSPPNRFFARKRELIVGLKDNVRHFIDLLA